VPLHACSPGARSAFSALVALALVFEPFPGGGRGVRLGSEILSKGPRRFPRLSRRDDRVQQLLGAFAPSRPEMRCTRIFLRASFF